MKHTRKFLRSKRHLAWCMYLRAMRTSFMLPYWIVPRDFVYFGISCSATPPTEPATHPGRLEASRLVDGEPVGE